MQSLHLTIRSTGTLDTVQVPRIVIRDRLSGKNITNEVGSFITCIETVDLQQIEDGVYQGSFGDFLVSVTMLKKLWIVLLKLRIPALTPFQEPRAAAGVL